MTLSSPTDFVREYGFKELSEANLVEMDEIWGGFVHFESLITVQLPDWFAEAKGIELTSSVPREVRAMFEVCRGAPIYGWYFYPLITLGTEQLFRLLELAVRAKLKAMGIRNSNCSFAKAINILGANGVLGQQEIAAWHSLRELRNWASHPRIQSITPPGRAITFASEIASMINVLYPVDQTAAS